MQQEQGWRREEKKGGMEDYKDGLGRRGRMESESYICEASTIRKDSRLKWQTELHFTSTLFIPEHHYTMRNEAVCSV